MHSALTSISPVDGRYYNKVSDLQDYYSEYALIKYRIRIEVEYFIALGESLSTHLQNLTQDQKSLLRKVYQEFSIEDAEAVKEIEQTTNHDVKAVEYFLKSKLEELGLESDLEFIHFGLTSQDINNTAVPLSLKEGTENVIRPALGHLRDRLADHAVEWENIPMLARTHGQPASPTRLGKEIMVFVERLDQQLSQLDKIVYAAKFGGATGNFNAHHVAFPDTDWKAFGKNFVEGILGLSHSFPTTQIEHYDHMAAYFDCLRRINTIIMDLDRDMWTYISMDYFKQKIKNGAVVSNARHYAALKTAHSALLEARSGLGSGLSR